MIFKDKELNKKELLKKLSEIVDQQTFSAFFRKGYKCGDKLQTPHFLSWAPIDLPKPKFHCPEFFGELVFE